MPNQVQLWQAHTTVKCCLVWVGFVQTKLPANYTWEPKLFLFSSTIFRLAKLFVGLALAACIKRGAWILSKPEQKHGKAVFGTPYNQHHHNIQDSIHLYTFVSIGQVFWYSVGVRRLAFWLLQNNMACCLRFVCHCAYLDLHVDTSIEKDREVHFNTISAFSSMCYPRFAFEAYMLLVWISILFCATCYSFCVFG